MDAEDSVECLVIGANGLVGRQIGRVFTEKGMKWHGTYCKRPEEGLLKLDVTNLRELENIFSKFLPKVIFHCANLAGGVDFCESNPEIATEFHLNATKNITDLCRRIDALLVFISSDYVFNGKKFPYVEDDLPNPLNLYGRLKLNAEGWIQKNLKKYLIVRTMNIYGWDPKTVTPNYIMNLYQALKDGKQFNAPSFLWGNPTYAGDLAQALVELYTKKANGIFHIAGSSFINRFEWAKEACKILEFEPLLVNEIKEPQPNMVPRPLRSCLSTDKFTSSYKTILHDVYDGLKLMKLDIKI